MNRSRHRWAVALAVVQPFLLSWLVVVVLTLLSYTLTASSTQLGTATWQDAARVGGSAWLLGVGAPIRGENVEVSLIPLLLSAAVLWATVRFVRRVGIKDRWDWAVAAGAGGLTALLIRALSLPGSSVLGAAVGGGVLAVVAGACALGSWVVPPRFAAYVAEGWRIARVILAALAVMGTVVLVIACVTGWDRITGIYRAYLTDGAGTVFLTVLQMCFLPAGLVWALAYMSGAGFAVGEGATFSALGSTGAPLPAIPFFGALPSPTTHAGWLVVLLVAAGLQWGAWEARRGVRITDTWPGLSGALIIETLVVAAAGALTRGGIGTGRMMQMGAYGPLLAGAVLLETFVPMLAVVGGIEAWEWWWARVRSEPATAPSPDDAVASASAALAVPGGSGVSPDAENADGENTDAEPAGTVEAGTAEMPAADDVVEDGTKTDTDNTAERADSAAGGED